jgi:hypothetical protein
VQKFSQMQKKNEKIFFLSHIPYFQGKIAKSWGKKMKNYLHISTCILEGGGGEGGIVCTIFKKPFWIGCRKHEHLMLHCFWDVSISHNIKI